MRGAKLLGCLALAGALILPTQALNLEQGRYVRGSYLASGKVSIAGVTVRYAQSKVRVTSRGAIKGFIRRIVSDGGRVISSERVRVRGRVSNVAARARTFSAPTRIRLEGTTVRGTLQGLNGTSQRLSRFFRGKIVGAPKSRFVLRAR